jgi:hypothetical protein
MKHLLLIIVGMCAIAAGVSQSLGYQDVGGDFGSTWLSNYGSMPVSVLEEANNLWNWGNAPKGYTLLNGTVYPPGMAPQWYYPYAYNDYTPIIINKTQSKFSQTSNDFYTDPWLLAQLTGRPVETVHEPHSVLS